MSDCVQERVGPFSEGGCPSPDSDGQHCEHWFDGYVCHWCGDGPMDPQQAVDQGMYETVDEAVADQQDFVARWEQAAAQPRGHGFEFGPDRAHINLKDAKSLS